MATKTPEINFLKKQRNVLMLQTKRIHLIGMLSIGTLAVYGVLLLGVASYSAFLSYQLNSNEKKIQKDRTALEKMAPTEAKYFNLKRKVGSILGITGSLFKSQETIEAVFKLLPEGLEVGGVSINEKGEINFGVTTSDMSLIDRLFLNINNNINNDGYLIEKADVSGVSVNDEGIYSMNMILRIKILDNK